MFYFKKEGHYFLTIKVKPNAAQTRIVGIISCADTKTACPSNEALLIEVKALPEKGNANKEVIKLLAAELKLPTACIKVKSGKSSRIKLISIETDQDLKKAIKQMYSLFKKK